MLVSVGTIAKTHGLKGECIIKTDAGETSALPHLARVTIEGQVFGVESATWMPSGWKVKLSGVNTIEEAARLRGGQILARREDLPPPQQDEYYVCDLPGCSVIDSESGRTLGEIQRVEYSDNGNEWWIVQGEEKAFLLPPIRRFVASVNIEGREIRVRNASELIL